MNFRSWFGLLYKNYRPVINLKTHAFLDYIVGLLLIVSPWIFGFYRGGIESHIVIFLGTAAIIYSLFTNYKWSILRIIPFRIHLLLDFISGLLLASSPWLFDFADYVFWPHLILGIFEIIAVLSTKIK